MGSRCVIKKVFTDNDSEFQKEVEIWSRLYHPNVLQLFGACHVGQPFLISEDAAHGQLDQYLRKLRKTIWHNREVWRTLHEAALGLQYLHSRSVVHCDLKCNNILIGRDRKAKVSDYGLSRSQQHDEQQLTDLASDSTSNAAAFTGVGAPRWKAPEVLNGLKPTIASDIYSFGMCVVEAVTGEYPWGMKDRDELVSDHVRRGGVLFSKPRGFGDAQWALVVGACRFDPKERLQMTEVVAQLEAIANKAKEADAALVAPSSMLTGHVEPEPERKSAASAWSGSAFDNLSIESAGDGSKVRDASYSESW